MAIQTVKATVNGTEYTLTYNSTSGMYEADIQAPASSSYPLPGGYYPVSVTATDTAGNSTTATHQDATLGNSLKLYVKEQVKPTVQITGPSAGAYVTTSRPAVTFTLRDNANGQSSGYSGIDTSTCVVKINGNVVSGATFTAIDGGYTGSVTPSAAIADGSCTVTVDVSDFDGNAADTASCTFTIDTVAPSLTVTAPADQYETNDATIAVSGTTDDATSKPIEITITVDGTDQGAVTVDANGAFSKNVTFAAEGSHTIIVSATDAAGKTTSVTRTVLFDQTAPVIESVTIAPNPVFAGRTYKISVKVY